MNREIKFRAWDKEKNKMIYLNDIAHDSYSIILFHHICMGGESPKTKEFPKGSDYIPMQFTGLKDKNGLEIYQGDIIKAASAIFQIAWNAMDGRLMPFTINSIQTENYIASSGVPIRDWNWLNQGKAIYFHKLQESFDIEVIGNIYENPELLI